MRRKYKATERECECVRGKKQKTALKTTKPIFFYLGKGEEVCSWWIVLDRIAWVFASLHVWLRLCEMRNWPSYNLILWFYYLIHNTRPDTYLIDIMMFIACKKAHIMINNVNLYRFQIEQYAYVCIRKKKSLSIMILSHRNEDSKKELRRDMIERRRS